MTPTPTYITTTDLYEAAFLRAYGFICDLCPRPKGGFNFAFLESEELKSLRSAYARDTYLQAFLASVERMKSDMRNISFRR